MTEYYSTPFPDQVPRQRRRVSQLTGQEDDALTADAGASSSNSPSSAATTNRRIKRSRSSPLTEKVKQMVASIRIPQLYIWLFIYLMIVLKILSNRFSGTLSSRNMRLSTAHHRSAIRTTVWFETPAMLQFAHSLGRQSIAHPTAGALYSLPLPYLGHLDFFSLKYMPVDKFYRNIHPEAYSWHEEEKMEQLAEIDFPNLEPENEPFVDMQYDPHRECHRLPWADDQRPTCNQFHEFVVLDRDPTSDMLQPYQRRYLAHGYFRDAWLLEPAANATSMVRQDGRQDESVVLKTLRIGREFSIGTVNSINKEALIMERMSASPRITNLYGHCYTSMLVEHGYEISQRMVQGIEYNGRGRVAKAVLDQEEKDGVKPKNNFTVEEKLEIALAMAEGIAELHGHPEGLILNDDVHPDQWLITADGSVKFNDFNNAHILNWNPRNNSYCKYFIWIGGDYRSPEELDGDPVDDKSDVWPMGANVFVLLSGLYPYYTVWDTKLIEKIIANGTRPFLDARYKERSLIEGGLYDIMQQCFEVDPEERVDIFTVVRHLRGIQEAVAAERANGDLTPYRGDVILKGLARHIISAEKRKQRQKELYLHQHGNLDGFEEATSYGEYEADEGDDDGSELEESVGGEKRANGVDDYGGDDGD